MLYSRVTLGLTIQGQHAVFKGNTETNYPKGNMLYSRVTLGLTIQEQHAVLNVNTWTNYPRAICFIQG